MERLFLGINSQVVCLDKNTGEQLWQVKLKSSSITNVYYECKKVFAYAGGHLFCLNAFNGEIIWENPLKGLGYGTCIIASDQQGSVIASQIDVQQAGLVAATVAAGAVAGSN